MIFITCLNFWMNPDLFLFSPLLITLESGLHTFVVYLGPDVALFTIEPNDMHASRFKKCYICHNSIKEKSFVA